MMCDNGSNQWVIAVRKCKPGPAEDATQRLTDQFDRGDCPTLRTIDSPIIQIVMNRLPDWLVIILAH